jgi:hypothetical protein
MVALFDGLPHGAELAKLNLYVATDEEVSQTCGASTMACYDPGTERMIVSGESEEVAGIPREAVIAHEYGHHIANNRSGGLWSALSSGTPRWSTYEHVCELARNGQVFPGDQGAHYWENPGEAFAQSYSQMVIPQSTWNYSDLLRPDAGGLTKLRMDVLRPWQGPRTILWRQGAPGKRLGGLGLGAAVAVGERAAVSPPVSRRIQVPVDGKLRVRLKTAQGAPYQLSLVDPTTGAVTATSTPAPGRRGVALLSYSACGQRQLSLQAKPLAEPQAFAAKIVVP